MARSFYSRQLLEVEVELMAVGKRADALGLDLGERADSMHFDGEVARPVDEAIAECRDLMRGLERAVGLLDACRLVFEAERGRG